MRGIVCLKLGRRRAGCLTENIARGRAPTPNPSPWREEGLSGAAEGFNRHERG